MLSVPAACERFQLKDRRPLIGPLAVLYLRCIYGRETNSLLLTHSRRDKHRVSAV